MLNLSPGILQFGAQLNFADQSCIRNFICDNIFGKFNLQMDRIAAFGLQAGYQHYSNGRGGEDSRSTNFLYAEPILGLYLFGPYHMKIAPRFFTYVKNDDDTNPDISDYMGYFDLEVSIADPEGLALDTRLWWAREGASVQVNNDAAFSILLSRCEFSRVGIDI